MFVLAEIIFSKYWDYKFIYQSFQSITFEVIIIVKSGKGVVIYDVKFICIRTNVNSLKRCKKCERNIINTHLIKLQIVAILWMDRYWYQCNGNEQSHSEV